MRHHCAGTPAGRSVRTLVQANCSWLIELGHGDKVHHGFRRGLQNEFNSFILTALEIPKHRQSTCLFRARHPSACGRHVGDFSAGGVGAGPRGKSRTRSVLYGPILAPSRIRQRSFRAPSDGVARLGTLLLTARSRSLYPDAVSEVDVPRFEFSVSARQRLVVLRITRLGVIRMA